MASRLKEVKAALQDDVLRLVRELVPGGQAKGNNYSARSPVRHDRKPGSFVVWIGGNAKGAFKDYADDSVKGDVVDLIALCKGLDRKEALAWAKDWLGWKSMSQEEKKKFQREVKKREARQKEEDLANLRRMVGPGAADLVHHSSNRRHRWRSLFRPSRRTAGSNQKQSAFLPISARC